LLERFRDPAPITGETHQPASAQTDYQPDERTEAELFDDELRQSHRAAFDFRGCNRHEEQEKRNGEPVVQAGFDLERLADAGRYARARQQLSASCVFPRTKSAYRSSHSGPASR
jgi:hypothetical protein